MISLLDEFEVYRVRDKIEEYLTSNVEHSLYLLEGELKIARAMRKYRITSLIYDYTHTKLHKIIISHL